VYGVLQNALEQHRKLGYRIGRVLFGQLQHGILNDIQSGIFVLDRKHRLFERPTLHLGEKRRNFLVGGQFSLPRAMASLDYKQSAGPGRVASEAESVDENGVSLYCLGRRPVFGRQKHCKSAVRVPSGGATSASGYPFRTRAVLI
jgi:hypothetical protein